MIQLISFLKEDIRTHGGNSISRSLLIFFFNVSFRLVLNYRIGRFLHERRNLIFSIIILFLKKRQLIRYNCDISYQAKIGRRILFPHPLSIVVGNGVEIGDDVMIWQGVTLGSHGKFGVDDKGYPSIRNCVKLFTDCKVLGPIEIGENSRVGSSALVTKNVSASHFAYGIPAITKKIRN